MNKNYIFVGGASALAGFVVGYLFCRKRYKDKFELEVNKAIDEEIARIRELNAIKSEPVKSEENPYILPCEVSMIQKDGSIPQFVADTFASDGEYSLEKRAEYEVIFRQMGYTDEDVNTWLQHYDEIAGEQEHPEEDDAQDHENEELENPEMMHEEEFWSKSPPEVISLDEYQNLSPYFSFVTFHYYEGDDTLVDDGDEFVDNIIGTIGNALDYFGDRAVELSGDEDAVYVRNGRLGLAIEVVRMHASFAEFYGLKE